MIQVRKQRVVGDPESLYLIIVLLHISFSNFDFFDIILFF